MVRTVLSNRISLMAAMMLFCGATQSNAATIQYEAAGIPSGSPDGPASATALFTINNGSLTITLSSLQQNPTSAGQLVSGIHFDLSGASGSGVLARTTDSALVTTISVGGGYTAGASDALARWEATETGSTIRLTTLSGGNPDRLIIGPDSQGSFDPSDGGLYSNANASIRGDNPNILGSATFTITIPGVTDGSTLSNVVFEFGTTPRFLDGRPSSVPEPSSLALLGLGSLGLAFGAYRRTRLAT